MAASKKKASTKKAPAKKKTAASKAPAKKVAKKAAAKKKPAVAASNFGRNDSDVVDIKKTSNKKKPVKASWGRNDNDVTRAPKELAASAKKALTKVIKAVKKSLPGN